MSPFPARPLLRLAAIGALVAALGLAGCGRKGPLEPPPGASLQGEAQPTASTMTNRPDLIGSSPIGSRSDDGNPGVTSDGRAIAPKGPHKRIPLDVLLN